MKRIAQITFALVLLAGPALAQQAPTLDQRIIQEAAQEASQQQQAAILARAQAADLRAKVTDLEKQLAEAKKKPDAPAE